MLQCNIVYFKRQNYFLFLCLPIQDADMLAGNEQAWKEVKEAINKMTTPKSQEGILSMPQDIEPQ